MRRHRERHKISNSAWLRAAVLGANDGIVSTSSLVLGVAGAQGTHENILIAGMAGLVAGAMSMAAGEYVSVSSQADSERSSLAQEEAELRSDPAGELKELVGIYVKRGLDPALATQVANQLMARDALGAHARDELGISAYSAARPLQAACASALSFACGAALPLGVVAATPNHLLVPMTSVFALVFLAALGAVAAKMGGSPIPRSVMRITFWSAMAMLVTHLIGTAFGTIVN